MFFFLRSPSTDTNFNTSPMPSPFWKFFIRYIEQWTKTFCKKTGRPGRSETGRPGRSETGRPGRSETGRPAGQPAMILKFTGRVEKILTGSISATGAMRNHLSLKHKILLDTKKTKQQASSEDTSMKGSTGASKIENYFKPNKQSLERVVAVKWRGGLLVKLSPAIVYHLIVEFFTLFLWRWTPCKEGVNINFNVFGLTRLRETKADVLY